MRFLNGRFAEEHERVDQVKINVVEAGQLKRPSDGLCSVFLSRVALNCKEFGRVQSDVLASRLAKMLKVSSLFVVKKIWFRGVFVSLMSSRLPMTFWLL